MKKINYQIVQGLFDDERQMDAYHIVMTEHTLLEDRPRTDNRGFEITDEHVIKIFTRYCECYEDAIAHALHCRGEIINSTFLSDCRSY
jgi:hypothetical protein